MDPTPNMILIISIQYCASGENYKNSLGLDNEIENIWLLTFSQQNFKQISTGAFFSLAVDFDKNVYGWGSNEDGQLSSKDKKVVNSPKQLFLNQSVKKVAAGKAHSLALLTDSRKILSFGANDFFQLGRFSEKENQHIPGEVNLKNLNQNEKIVDLQTQNQLNYVLTDLNQVYVWGKCGEFTCLRQNKDVLYQIPTKVEFAHKITKMHLLQNSFFVQNDKGDVYAIGSNEFGNLCTGDKISTNVFQKTKMTFTQQIAAGEQHTVFLKNGTVYGCGSAQWGQLGNATKLDIVTSPIAIANGQYIQTTNYGTLLVQNNKLYATGSNQFGELSLANLEHNYHQFTETKFKAEKILIRKVVSNYQSTFAIIGSVEEEEEASKKEEEEIITPTNNLSTWEIVGIAIGSVAALALIIIAVYLIVKKVKKGKQKLIEKNNQVTWFTSELVDMDEIKD